MANMYETGDWVHSGFAKFTLGDLWHGTTSEENQIFFIVKKNLGVVTISTDTIIRKENGTFTTLNGNISIPIALLHDISSKVSEINSQ